MNEPELCQRWNDAHKFWCTLYVGHTGRHVAVDGFNHVHTRWSDETTPQQEGPDPPDKET